MRQAWVLTWPKLRAFFTWTGFGQKHLVDYMQMFVVPIVVLLAGTFVSQSVNASAQKQAAQQAQDKRVQDYLAQMTTLVLDRDLLGRKSGGIAPQTVRDVARAQTATALNGMDGARRRFVVTFLYEQGLISGLDPLVSMRTADLSGTDLHEAELFGANLQGALLTSADFTRARLTFVRLNEADLQRANLEEALLVDAKLNSADLRVANMTNAEMGYASFFHADLRSANLRGASLANANLISADLRGADLRDVNFQNATLTDALLDPSATPGGRNTSSGTVLDGIKWSNTVCPDGTNSDKNDNSCKDHLKPRS